MKMIFKFKMLTNDNRLKIIIIFQMLTQVFKILKITMLMISRSMILNPTREKALNKRNITIN
jgi:hypothetical protein